MKPTKRHTHNTQRNCRTNRPEPFMAKGKAPLFLGEQNHEKTMSPMSHRHQRPNCKRRFSLCPLMSLFPRRPRQGFGAPRPFAPQRPGFGAPRPFAPQRRGFGAPHPFAPPHRKPF